MNKSRLRLIGLITVACVTVVFLISFIQDFCDYQSIAEGTYKTPWYSRNVFRQPYTNFRVACHNSEFNVVTNACGSQIWVVKDTMIGDKQYWTVLIRVNIAEKTLDEK